MGTMLSHLEPFGAMWSHLEPFRAIWRHLEPFGAIWSHLELFGSIWSPLKPFEAACVIIFKFRGLCHSTCIIVSFKVLIQVLLGEKVLINLKLHMTESLNQGYIEI